MRSFLIVAFHFDLDPRALRAVPFQPAFPVDVRLVPGGVDRDIELRSKRLALDAAHDVQRFADGELCIHARGGYSHSLLATRLAELVEFRPIQELAEDAGDLTFDDAGPVILHGDERLSSALPHFDSDLGQYSSFLARIERVVDGLLDGRDQRLGRRIETEQMTILEEELRD